MKDSGDKSEAAPRWIASPVTLHAVQCARCFKWRVVPTKEHYEAIREHILEQPWFCENAVKWRPESHCNLPADIEQDQSMVWAIDKPNVPSAPVGWERQITVRTDGSSRFADVYYTSPLGSRLRSKVEIEKFIVMHPESVPPETTMDQFSFAIPKPLPGVCPQLSQARGKLASPNSQTVLEQQGGASEQAIQSADSSSTHEFSTRSPEINAAYHPKLDGDRDFGGGNMPQLQQVTPISPQSSERKAIPSKRMDPGFTTPTHKRTKQQIKRDRLGMDVSLSPSSEQQLPVPSSGGIISVDT